MQFAHNFLRAILTDLLHVLTRREVLNGALSLKRAQVEHIPVKGALYELLNGHLVDQLVVEVCPGALRVELDVAVTCTRLDLVVRYHYLLQGLLVRTL